MVRFAHALVAAALLVSACAPARAVAPEATTAYVTGSAALVVHNASRETITRIYLSPSSARAWGPDQLGTRVLYVGQRLTLHGLAPGRWDVRVVDASGHVKEWRLERFDAGGVYTAWVDAYGWSGR